MPQRDYIMREIEKIGAMLRMIIRRLFEMQDEKEVLDRFEEIATELALESDVQFEELIKLEKDDFASWFSKNKGFNSTNIELLADLFAHLSRIVGDPQAILYKQKAIELYQYVDEKEKTFSMLRAGKISDLNQS